MKVDRTKKTNQFVFDSNIKLFLRIARTLKTHLVVG